MLHHLALGALLTACGANPRPAPERPAEPTIEQLAQELSPAPRRTSVAVRPSFDAGDLEDAARHGDRLVMLQVSGSDGRLSVVEPRGRSVAVEERFLERMAVATDAPVVVAQTSEGTIGEPGDEEIIVYGLDGLDERARWHREATVALAVSPNGQWVAAAGGGFIDLFAADGTRVHRRVLVPAADRDPETPAFWYSTTQRLSVDDEGTIVTARCDTTLEVITRDGDVRALAIPWDPPDPDAAPDPCEGEEDEDGARRCSYVPPNPNLVARFLRREGRLVAVTFSGMVVEWRSLRARPRVLIGAGCDDAELRAMSGEGTSTPEDLESDRYACSLVRGAHLTPDGRRVVVQSYEWVSRRFDLRTRRRDVGRVPESDLIIAPADDAGETVWLLDSSGRPRRWSRASGEWAEPDDVIASLSDEPED